VARKNYEILEHTADIRILVKANTLQELFRKSAIAMFDIMSSRRSFFIGRAEYIDISLKADSLEELFVEWLNELISLSAVKQLVFTDFKIVSLVDNKLRALVRGHSMRKFLMKLEIKAATRHELKIEHSKKGLSVQIIFDV